MYFGIKYLIRGNNAELSYLANQISNGDPKIVAAAQQINASMQQSAPQIAQQIQDRFAEACTKVIGYSTVYVNRIPIYGEVHNQFCDAIRSSLSNVSGDTSGLGALILLGGGMAGVMAAIFGLVRRD